jgi:hypothetical protein
MHSPREECIDGRPAEQRLKPLAQMLAERVEGGRQAWPI